MTCRVGTQWRWRHDWSPWKHIMIDKVHHHRERVMAVHVEGQRRECRVCHFMQEREL